MSNTALSILDKFRTMGTQTIDVKKCVAEAKETVMAYCQVPGEFEEFYSLQKANDWTVAEISCVQDADDYEKRLSPSEQVMVKCIVMFFLLGDMVVVSNIRKNLMRIFSHREDIIKFLTLQESVEYIHMDTYMKIAKSIFTSNMSLLMSMLSEAVDTYVSVSAKIFYGHYWLSKEDADPIDVVLTAICNEGIFFFTQFKIISAIRGEGTRMSGLDDANSFIRVDESIHRDAGVKMLITLIQEKAAETGTPFMEEYEKYEPRFIEIVKDAVEIEILSIKDIFKGATETNISEESMIVEAKCCANDIAEIMRYKKIYQVERPTTDFTTLELLVKSKANIWERDTKSYVKPNDNSQVDWDNVF